MTIRRRLFISNILMVIIPIIITIVVSVIAVILFWVMPMSRQKERISDESDYIDAREVALHTTMQLLEEETIFNNVVVSKMEDVLAKNEMSVEVFHLGEKAYSMGEMPSQFAYSKLKGSLEDLGGEGTVATGTQELYGKEVVIDDEEYIIYIMGNKEFTEEEEEEQSGEKRLLIVLAVILFGIIITNRFLTRSIFRKIKEPLDILAEGVNEIYNGNLDYHIQYNQKDEFYEVCLRFNEMATQLKTSIEMTKRQEQNRKELLVGISHDLRSPLTSIKAYVEGLLDGIASSPEKEKEYMQMIKTKADDIDRMVAKLFLFSKMDLGDYPYTAEMLDVTKEIHSLVYAIKEEYEGKGLIVKISRLAEESKVYVDAVQLRSVLSNIIENSLKYKTKEKGQILISSENRGNQVCITMVDDGDGVPPEALDKLFDVFYRSDPSRTNPNKGSGLGLAITAKAIERMKGSIYARNQEGGGLALFINLPLNREEEKV